MRAFLPFTQQYQGSNSCQKMQYSVISESFFFSYLAVVVVDGSSDDKTVASKPTETLGQREVLIMHYLPSRTIFSSCSSVVSSQNDFALQESSLWYLFHLDFIASANNYLESNYRISIYLSLFSTEFTEGDKRGLGDRKMLRLNDQHLAHTVLIMEMPLYRMFWVIDDNNKTWFIHAAIHSWLLQCRTVFI